ncbi:MAG TPA: hypothetical protein VNP92_17305 [Actinophytocola sp.]|nr:hypothetical protein [Actinophytocola sp.]
MSTYPPPADQSRRRTTGPGRVLAIVASIFLLVIGACVALAGVVLMMLFGTDGEINTARNPVTTETAAVVTDIASIRDTSEVADALGTPTARLAGDGGNASGLFIGVGPAADVDSYLADVAIDQATNFELDPYRLDLARREGSETDAAAPTEQDFWVASTDGTAALEMTWDISDGDFRVVVMNADGTAGVDSELSVGFGLGAMFGLALGLVIGGGMMIIVGIALLVFTRPRSLPPVAYGYSGGYPPPTGNGPLAGTAPPADPGRLTPPTGQPVSHVEPPRAADPPPADPVPPPPVREPLS